MNNPIENKDWEVYLLIEFILIVISFVIPISPSKTGSDKSLVDWFYDNPTFFEKVLINFLLLHLLALVIFIIYFLWKLFNTYYDNTEP